MDNYYLEHSSVSLSSSYVKIAQCYKTIFVTFISLVEVVVVVVVVVE